MSLRRLVRFLAAVAVVIGACTSAPAEGYEELTDINGVEQLSSEFNAQEGSPRLILLLSPT